MTTITTRRRTRARRSQGGSDRLQVSAWLLLLGLGLALIGGVPFWSLAILGALAMVGALLLRGDDPPPTSSMVALGLCCVSLLQTLPLPAAWLRVVSPMALEIWSSASGPLGSEPSQLSISIDRNATAAEALKWGIYSCTLALSASLARTKGKRWCLSAIYWAFVALAMTPLLHNIVGVGDVFGLYQPLHLIPRWTLSPILNPNNLSSLLNLGTFVGLGLALDSKPSPQRGFVWATLPLLVGVSLLSGSRAGVALLALGLLLVLSGVVFFRPALPIGAPHVGRLQNIALLCATMTSGLALAVFAVPNTFWLQLFDNNLEKLQMVLWMRPLVSQFFLTGVGAGAFSTGFQRYRQMEGNYVAEHPENFLLGWVSDWGVIVGLGALLAFCVALRPRRLGRWQGPLVPTVALGAGTLVMHNLVDVGFAVPGVMLPFCAVLGTLWNKPAFLTLGARIGSRQLRISSRFSNALGLSLAASLLLLVVFGFRSVQDDQIAVHTLHAHSDFSHHDERDFFFQSLDVAMQRHPADSYLALAGAVAAEQGATPSPIAWTAEALRRDPKNARAYLLLSKQLHRRGALDQALLTLQRMVEISALSTGEAVSLASSWTSEPQELRRLIPPGERGAQVLVGLASTLKNESLPLGLEWLTEALKRDPDSLPARVALAQLLLKAQEEHLSPCDFDFSCLAAVQRMLAHPSITHSHQENLGAGETILILSARLLFLQGKQEQAIEMLRVGCSRQLTACLRSWLSMTQATGQNLREPAGPLLELECLHPSSCAATHRTLSALYQSRGELAQALGHLRSSAEAAPSKEVWLSVSHLASKAQREDVQKDAQRRAEQYHD